MRNLATAVTAALLLLCISSCTSTIHETWPIPQLTVPSGSVRQPFRDLMLPYTEDGMIETPESSGQRNNWCIRFDNSKGYKHVYKHVDRCVKKAGYETLSIDRATIPSRPAASRVAEAAWINADKSLYVLLTDVGTSEEIIELDGPGQFYITIHGIPPSWVK